jgi:ribonuclease BN (tRNA processing enzyme)
MKITFLGVSGALSAKYNSNMLIENGKQCMLFDCGEDVMHSLKAAGRTPEELTDVYISHLHFDHCGGLSWLGYYSYFILKKRLILHVQESLVSDLWAMLRPAMERLDGQPMMTLSDYFEVRPIRNEAGGFLFGGGLCNLSKQLHVETKHGHMYSYGLSINCDDKRTFISSDTKDLKIPSTSEFEYREECDYKYIFCDCDVMNLGGIHPNYDTLKLFAKETKSKMWLYHYHDLGEDMPDAVADGFAGFVKEGQIFEL